MTIKHITINYMTIILTMKVLKLKKKTVINQIV